MSAPLQGTAEAVQRLNRDCHCAWVDGDAERAMRGQLSPRAAQALGSNVLAQEPVFVSRADAEAIEAFVRALEQWVDEPAYVRQAIERAPAVAASSFGPRGAMLGLDFHLSPEGPKLIEVNTNPGGALLAAAQLERPFSGWRHRVGTTTAECLRDELAAVFRREWAAQRGDAPLRRIAIVDAEPGSQPLLAELELYASLLRTRETSAIVVDVADLRYEGGTVFAHGEPIDLIYNRSTDFYLASPSHEALRRAYLDGAVVLTPHPRAHALYADKANLIAMSQRAGADAVPGCRVATAELWADRKQYFFKPAAGYGSRGVYRGSKLTRRVWDALVADRTYVAQRYVPAPRRTVRIGAEVRELKYDVRAFAYAGRVLMLAARLYRGQATNLSTAGGGFAPVVVV